MTLNQHHRLLHPRRQAQGQRSRPPGRADGAQGWRPAGSPGSPSTTCTRRPLLSFLERPKRVVPETDQNKDTRQFRTPFYLGNAHTYSHPFPCFSLGPGTRTESVSVDAWGGLGRCWQVWKPAWSNRRQVSPEKILVTLFWPLYLPSCCNSVREAKNTLLSKNCFSV